MSGEPAEGGCLCGAIRYRVTGEPVAATLCHCRSCRRASGGTNVAWAVFDKSALEWLADEPVAYSSSRGIEWLHCHGSLVGYRRSSRPEHIDITDFAASALAPPASDLVLYPASVRVGAATHSLLRQQAQQRGRA